MLTAEAVSPMVSRPGREAARGRSWSGAARQVAWLSLVLSSLLQPGAARGQARSQAAAAADFDAIMRHQNRPEVKIRRASTEPWEESSSGGPAVEISLTDFTRLWRKVRQTRQAPSRRRPGPAVMYGESRYTGRAVPGGLMLKLELRVTLDRPGRWKMVPLVGSEVVLTRAAVAGKAISAATHRGYHVWVTRGTGQHTIELEMVVPSRGPRGSIEYDFVVVRAPVTRFICRFPMKGLKPRLDQTVTTTITAAPGTTVLDATLRPTNRIHLLGFKDLGDSRTRKARVFVRTMNLLSVGRKDQEMFSVLKYTILYAGAKEFKILVPGQTTVVSAAGKGAFRYTLERRAGGTLIRGETAFPIRKSYEISLRLRQARRAGQRGRFRAPLPRALEVEREAGWLAVEVPDKLRLQEQKRDLMQAIDVRQLPPELVRSAVSPILKAYRYHAAGRRLGLIARRLPEQETAAESIDRVRAFTVVSAEGSALTEMRLTLRNRLRRSVTLRLPPGARLRSALLDGRPVKPSQDSDGQILLPLSRSVGRHRLSAITLQVVMEQQVGALSLAGRPRLSLPAPSLPVAVLAWSVFLPPRNIYRGLSGGQPRYVGQVSWRRPAAATAQQVRSPRRPLVSAGLEPVASVDTGAMPVRIKLPRTGVRLEHSRYWIKAGQPVEVRVTFLGRKLIYPLVFLLMIVCLVGLLLACGVWPGGGPRAWRLVGTCVLLLTAWPLVATGGWTPLLVIGLAVLLVITLRRGWFPRAVSKLREWGVSLPERFVRRSRSRPMGRWQAIRHVALSLALAAASLALLIGVARLMKQLMIPLAG